MNRSSHLLLLIGGMGWLAACDARTPALAPSRPTIPKGTGSFATTSCEVSFRMIATDSDSLMAQYGIPSTVDTVDVCESWTGSDYIYQATTVGSSDNVPGFADTVPTVTYQSGYVTGYDAWNNTSAPAGSVGSTSFDFVKADPETRQASYDYPYYGVSSPDPTPSSCVQPPCAVQSVSVAVQSPNKSTQVPPPFARYGLSRRGVRALVDSSEELTPSPQGYRRFRSTRGSRTRIRLIDPKTQLLVGEDELSPEDSLHIVHSWHKVPNGYVRQQSDMESMDLVNGRWIKNRSRVEFKKVRINDPTFIVDADTP
jgi:hypothetical protein